jgi:hypothetical protein
MNKFLLIKFSNVCIIILGFIYGQETPEVIAFNNYAKVDYFLQDQTRFDLLGVKSTKIKKELRKLEDSFNDELKITKKKRTLINEKFDEDGYLNAILDKESISNKELAQLRKSFLIKEYTTETILNETSSRLIRENKLVYNNQPKWSKIKEYITRDDELKDYVYDISKDDSLKFELFARASEIELIDLKNCYIKIQIEGHKKFAFKFHQIQKVNYKYKGSVQIPRFTISDIYENIQPSVVFSFKNKKYLPKQDFIKPIKTIMSPSIDLDELFKSYNKMITQIFDDFISDSEFYEANYTKTLVGEFNKKYFLIEKAKKIQVEEKKWLDKTKYNSQTYFNLSLDLETLEKEIKSMVIIAKEVSIKKKLEKKKQEKVESLTTIGCCYLTYLLILGALPPI